MPKINIDWIAGNCPVQAEGKINGKPFYFRARGNRWSISIGSWTAPEWEHSEPYGDYPYAAGWMDIDVAAELIEDAAGLYMMAETNKTTETRQ